MQYFCDLKWLKNDPKIVRMVLHKTSLLLVAFLAASMTMFAQKPVQTPPTAQEDDILLVDDAEEETVSQPAQDLIQNSPQNTNQNPQQDINQNVVETGPELEELPESKEQKGVTFDDNSENISEEQLAAEADDDVFATEDNEEQDMAELEEYLASYDGDTLAAEAEDTLGVHPLKEISPVATETSLWSVYVAAGMNLFDGDYSGEKKHAFYAPTVSIGAAYHFTNTWALGLEYKFHNYKVFGKPGHAHTLLAGRTHQAGGYISFDVFNCFRPQNKHKLFALDLILGASAFWFKNQVYYVNRYKQVDKLGQDFVFLHNTLTDVSYASDKFKCYAMFIGGASFEFNVNRSLQVGIRALYNYTTTDLVDGRPRGNNNDGIFDLEALLRYKIDAVDKSHTRNFRSKEALQSMNEEEPRIAAKDTLYIYHKDTVYIINEGGIYGKRTNTMPGIDMEGDKHYYYVVYFNNDSHALDNASKRIIAEASEKMLQDYDLYALVVGSCDNTGDPQYNNWLAVKRSYNVAKEMSRENNVEMGRMHTVGKGIITENNQKKGSYRPNRRVEIHLLTREEYDKAKQLYKDLEKNKDINRGDALKLKMKKNSKSSANKVSITVPDDLNLSDGAHITVQKATTLRSLAQTHYNNANCWIYLYLANGEFISSPSYIPRGTTIMLPQLTESQLKITAEGAAKLQKQYVKKE